MKGVCEADMRGMGVYVVCVLARRYVDSCFFGGFISSVLLEQAVQGQ
jgi:hypothetical protein